MPPTQDWHLELDGEYSEFDKPTIDRLIADLRKHLKDHRLNA